MLYFVFQPDVEITVDNAGTGPLTVFLDGSEALTVPSNTAKKLSWRSGRRHIIVKRGAETVFDETEDLQGGRHVPRKYLLNPEARNRYWVRTVHYGLDLPSFEQIADQIELAPVGPWVDVNPDLVLEPPPKEVKATVMDSRKVLSRISAADYDLIAVRTTVSG